MLAALLAVLTQIRRQRVEASAKVHVIPATVNIYCKIHCICETLTSNSVISLACLNSLPKAIVVPCDTCDMLVQPCYAMPLRVCVPHGWEIEHISSVDGDSHWAG